MPEINIKSDLNSSDSSIQSKASTNSNDVFFDSSFSPLNYRKSFTASSRKSEDNITPEVRPRTKSNVSSLPGASVLLCSMLSLT
eukprot:Awhi_evm1s8782